MKRILITGINSYIGKSFKQYMTQFPNYKTVSISMRDGSWEDEDFSGFDVIYHVAGLAHSDNGKISSEKAEMYYRINRDLTIRLAEKAKREGVGQFIFMSSAIVYGDSGPIGEKRVINPYTVCSPANCYGDSKVQAEIGLKKLQSDNFRVVILRPPMIYGPGCKGNYPVLSLFAEKLPFFPYIKNERSMLFVGNLMAFVKLMIDNNESGVFFPQNREYSNTSELVAMIAEAKGKKIVLLRGLTWAVKFLGIFTGLVNKAFGNLSYDMCMSEYDRGEYRIYSLPESIRITEGAE
jgi:UDP-glucose 4-epimerase